MTSTLVKCGLLACALLWLCCCCWLPEASAAELPALFNFGTFIHKFGKSYASLSERAVRQQLFLARAFRAFVSAVAYKLKRRSHYLAVNARSDWTEAELEATLMRAEPPSDMARLLGGAPAPLVEPGELERQLKQIESSARYGALAAELRALKKAGARRKRSPTADAGAPDARTEREFHAHPLYRPVLYRWPVGGERRPELAAAAHKSPAGRDFLLAVLGNFVAGLGGLFGDDEPKQDEQARDAGQAPPDETIVDHRRSGCLLDVQEQGKCASCYAFAAMAYLEWAHCMETRRREQFAVQYVLDCGRRAGGLNGCRSGKTTSVAEFVNNFGLELERHYPYVGSEQQCPYEPATPFDAMGYLRVRLGHVLRVPLDYAEHYLRDSPMVVSLAVGPDFSEYGGGVDAGLGCGTRATHSMLLIGHGRQRGREYWLLRNSYSADFGEQGHYKLDKFTGSRCFVPREGFVYARDEHATGAPRLFAQRNAFVPEPIGPRKATSSSAAARDAPQSSPANDDDDNSNSILEREVSAAEARERARKGATSAPPPPPH